MRQAAPCAARENTTIPPVDAAATERICSTGAGGSAGGEVGTVPNLHTRATQPAAGLGSQLVLRARQRQDHGR